MAVRKILRIGDPGLREVSLAVPENEIGSKEIKNLIRDMFDTMQAADGVGLAAPQIGVFKRVVVVGFDRSDRYPDIKDTIEQHVLINPEIEVLEGVSQVFWEACLSVPGMRGVVERVRKIRCKWYDPRGDLHDEVIEGFDAVVYQHECDHLEGILYVDRLADPTLFGFNEELDKADEATRKVG